MEAVTATRVFEPGWRPDIKDIVLTAYVSVLNFIDFFPFHAKPMKAVNETGVFVDGGRRRCCKIPAGTCSSQCGAGGGLRAKAQSEPGVVGE